MSKGSNSKRTAFLKAFPSMALDDDQCDILKRCKFCFSYYDTSQEYSADLEKWDERNLQGFFKKLKEYSRHSLAYWQQRAVGSHKHHVLEVYGAFPHKSRFQHPLHVPSDVDWARFRMDGEKRLIGFTIPKTLCRANSKFDDNTFYIVFLDLKHNFYLASR